MADVANLLRSAGMRMTQQRHRVVRAVELRPHSTPDELIEAVVADGGPTMPPSTIYRTLEALQKVGVVDHTHLDHGPPTYHLAGTHGHLHLVCRNCAAVEEVPASLAEVLVDRLRGYTDFAPDPTHMAIHGHCAACQEVLP